MKKFTFPFAVFQYPDGSVDPMGHPCLWLNVVNPEKNISEKIWGLVDTGADSSLFPATLAVNLGHNLKGNGVKSTTNIGIEQKEITVYSHSFTIELLDPEHKDVIWKSENTTIDCSETNPPVLIGVNNFLKNFKLTIDYPNQEFELEWTDDKN